MDPRAGAQGGQPLDRYVVLEYLAEGGMGAIYLGKKLGAGGFEKDVVLKQLLPEFTRQPEFIDLFLREARLSATLDHANIIHTIDLVTAGEEYFIVMEYLPGADLRSLLKRAKRRKGRFSPAAGVLVAREVLSALSYAHAKNGPDGRPLRLIHRDISPSNILISRNGEVKLTDFGIAKASTHNSVFYRVKGKIGYMSPEQAKSEPLDSRSDLYSLAVCLYEMVTGERLFVAAGLTTSADELYSRPVPPVSRKVEGVPTDFDNVILKALSIDRRGRYQTAGEFQDALARVAHRHQLMMSAPELADHLTGVCGDPARWRNIDQTQDGGDGTELYEPQGTEQIHVEDLGDYDDDDADSADLIEVLPDARPAERRAPSVLDMAGFRSQRQKSSITHLTRLQGMELTSMINVADIGDAGAEPLVDLDIFEDEPGIEETAEIAEIAEIARVAGSDRPDSSTNLPASRLAPLANLDEESVTYSGEVGVDDDEGSSGQVWVILALILLLGVGIVAAIGFTGPKLQDPPPAPDTTEPAP